MKEKLVELAQKNAELVLSQDKEKIKREEGRTIGAMKEIAGWLDLPGLQRVEAFDISNINGFETVGSMVVYEKGKPKRSDYRKFKLRTVTGPDDYASMHEVLTRRFTHGMREQEEMQEKELGAEYGSFTRFPDLIMMDGGRGQVNICLKVLDELHLNIPVCGMVKDDNHRTRGYTITILRYRLTGAVKDSNLSQEFRTRRIVLQSNTTGHCAARTGAFHTG